MKNTEHKFITIGEIMLRLTPPDYEKIRTATTFEARYEEAKPMLPYLLQTLESIQHFVQLFRTIALEKVQFV